MAELVWAAMVSTVDGFARAASPKTSQRCTERIGDALELVEGEDLSERMLRGKMPIEDALTVTRQICEALEAAHHAGVVHRDLKPANVMLTSEGKAKVLDFGLAKLAADPEPASGASASRSPTMTSAGTQAGMILGTAAYMSPEQARGRAVDQRGDIWALGCLLFEMLTGQAAFRGETVTDTLAAVVRADPDMEKLPPETPMSVRRLLGLLPRCSPVRGAFVSGNLTTLFMLDGPFAFQDAMPDGERFLVLIEPSPGESQPIHLMLDWQEFLPNTSQ